MSSRPRTPADGLAPSDTTYLRRRRLAASGVGVLVIVCLVWLTWACLVADVVCELSPDMIRGGRAAWVRNLPLPPSWWPGDVSLEVTEDGRSLGPQVGSERAVRDMLRGAFALTRFGGFLSTASATLHFSASDDTAPSRNGRRYAIRFPRRQLPASTALLLAAWLLLPVMVWCWWNGAPTRSESGVAAWSVLVGGALFSLFVVQAWLPLSNATWLLAVAGVGLAPFLARLSSCDWALPTWLPWVGGFLGWAALSSLVGSSYASPATAAHFVLVAIGGFLCYLGLSGVLAAPERSGSGLMLGLFAFAIGLSLARDAGFDLLGVLAPLRSGPTFDRGVINLWTTKYTAHWLLALGWCTVAALGRSTPGGGGRAAIVAILGSVAIVSNGSISALLALAASLLVAGFALRWPFATRRLLVATLVIGLLAAPALASLPWSLRGNLLTSGSGAGILGEATREVRSGVWEYSRRLVSIHPLVGWGFGASGTLPGRQISIAEALGVEPQEADSQTTHHPALAGGHPHNGALLTWLDLGLVGVLLLSGLIIAVGTAIAGTEEQRLTHASLLALVATTATFLALNYPAWEPEVASMLWMSAIAAAAVVPRPSVGRRERLVGGIAALLVLCFGCALFLQNRVARWWIIRDLRQPGIVLELENGRLIDGEKSQPLEFATRLDAGAELVGEVPETSFLLRGWSYEPANPTRRPVLVFVGPALVGTVWPERPSPAVYARTRPRDIRALTAGFFVRLEPGQVALDAPVTIVAYGPDGSLARTLPPLAAE